MYNVYTTVPRAWSLTRYLLSRNFKVLLKAGTEILYISLEYIPDTLTKNNITVIEIGITKNEKAEISMYFNSFNK